MSEFEQGSYQTSNEPVSQEPSIQQEQTQTQEPVATQEPNYFEIKYNKEPVKVSYDEAPTYIQKGLNYDKVSQRATEYESQLNRTAQLMGYESHDQLMSALDEYEQQVQRQQYEEAGINPDLLNQAIEQHPAVQYAKQMEQKQQEEQMFQQEANELFSEFPDLKPEQIPPEVWTIKEQKGLSLLDSYLRVSFKSLGQQKEQEAIQKLQNNAVTSPGSLGGGDVGHDTSIQNMSKNDFESLVRKVKNGEVQNL